MPIYLALDTETTGKPKDFKKPYTDVNNWPKPVSVAIVLISGAPDDLHITGSFTFYIETDPGDVSPEAQAKHQIPPELLRAGITQDAACSLISATVTALRPSSIVAHNEIFDRSVLGAMFHRQGRQMTWRYTMERIPWICTMQQHTDILRLPGKYGYKWPTLTETYDYYFDAPISGVHDALSDALATAKVYIAWQRDKASEGVTVPINDAEGFAG